MPEIAAAIHGVIPQRPIGIVLNLRHVIVDDTSVSILSLIRRCAQRHDVPVWLAAVPRPLLDALHAAHLRDLFTIVPTLAAAADTALAAQRRLGPVRPRVGR